MVTRIKCVVPFFGFRGYRGWNTLRALEVLDEIFPKELSDKTRVILTTAPPISEAARLEHGRIKFGGKGAKYLDRSNERAGEYAAACRAASQKMGAGNIDLWTSIQRQPDWQTTCLTDGLHLSALGSIVMLEELLKILKDSTWQPSLHRATMSGDFSESSIYSYVHPSEEDVELARVSSWQSILCHYVVDILIRTSAS